MTLYRAIAVVCAGLACGFATRLSADQPSPAPAAPARPAAHAERTFSESDLLALLTATLQRDHVQDRGELELRLTQPWKTLKVPDEPLSLEVLDLPTMGVTSMFIVRFELRTPQRSLGTWQAPVQARVWREVWVARSDLPRGDSVSDPAIERERRDVLTLHEPLADFEPGDSNLMLAEPVRAGAPLLARAVKLRPVLHRGQLADAVVRDGALSVTIKVEVLEDGVPGQVIRARNPQSRRDIRGKVINEHTILVAL
jgi:flagella basal body P-ring formation protein FlgA